MKSGLRLSVSGAAAGTVNGLLGGGGGMVLLPLLTGWCGLDEKKAFATSTAIMLPICMLSTLIYFFRGRLDLMAALPYLLGGLAGGAVGGRLMGRVPVIWLRRLFAAFLIYGGLRYLL